MARLFTWTGRGGGDNTLLSKQFSSIYTYNGKPTIAYQAAAGGYCMDMNGFGCCTRVAVGSRSDVYVGVLLVPTNEGSGERCMVFMSGSTILASLRRNLPGSASLPFPYIAAYRGDFATFLAGGDVIWPWSAAVYMEVYYKADPTNGRIIIKQNGRTAIDYTGQTVPASQTTLDTVVFGAQVNTQNVYYYMNDIVVDDANWPGISIFDHLVPNGAGNAAQWSPTTSPNEGCVDETPPSLSDFNYTNTADQTDSFACENLVAAADVVKSVNVQVFALKENAPTPTQIKPLVRTGSTPTDYLGDGKTVDINLTNQAKVWQNNPYTSSGWQVSEVNGMEIGYKSAA